MQKTKKPRTASGAPGIRTAPEAAPRRLVRMDRGLRAPAGRSRRMDAGRRAFRPEGGGAR